MYCLAWSRLYCCTICCCHNFLSTSCNDNPLTTYGLYPDIWPRLKRITSLVLIQSSSPYPYHMWYANLQFSSLSFSHRDSYIIVTASVTLKPTRSSKPEASNILMYDMFKVEDRRRCVFRGNFPNLYNLFCTTQWSGTYGGLIKNSLPDDWDTVLLSLLPSIWRHGCFHGGDYMAAVC